MKAKDLKPGLVINVKAELDRTFGEEEWTTLCSFRAEVVTFTITSKKKSDYRGWTVQTDKGKLYIYDEDLKKLEQ